jgi:hypothetical protein
MKNLIRIPLLFLLLGLGTNCGRDNSSDSSTPEQPSNQAAAPGNQSIETPDPPEGPNSAPQRAAPKPGPAPARVEKSSPDVTSPPATESKVASPGGNIRVRPERPDRAAQVPAAATETVPAGTSLTVVMTDEVSTATSKEGDTFHAALAEPWVVDGRVVAERGDKTVGRVEEVVSPGRVKGRAQLKLVLTELSTGDRRYKIKTEPFVAIAVDNKERDAAIIAGGTGVGAAIGAITGGKKGAAIGAIIGGGGGTATVLATPGRSMKIEPETKVNFVLDNDVRLPVIRSKAD